MKLQQQLITNHDPDNGIYGDCYRTCIACLIDMDAADVPHFMGNALSTGFTQVEADFDASQWLEGRGFKKMAITLDASNKHTNRVIQELTAGMPYILTGQSPNFPDVAHCVIAQDGPKVIHDVSINRPRQIEPYYDKEADSYFWFLEMIVRLPN